MYNYFLGGAGHRDADRQAARSVTAHHGEVTAIAKANRAFVLSAVTHLAARGITQFLDLGAGLPAFPSVHEAARIVNPAVCVAYVDNDPQVLARASQC